MNKKFMFSIALLMSIILGSGFASASHTAMAVVITYPNTNTLYDNAYNSSDDKYSSNYGESEYDYVYYNNDNNNNDTYTNNDKYSSNYGESEYDYIYYNNDNNNNDTYTNNDRYLDSYSKHSNTYNNNNKNNDDRNDSSDDDKYLDSYNNSDEYSKYPTNDKLYECQKGPLEGFFTSSVEFCVAANSNTK